MSGNVSEIVVAHRDRLCRFGFELVESIANKHNCSIVVLDESKLSPQAELINDLLLHHPRLLMSIVWTQKYSRKIKEDSDLSQEQALST
ncbi:MAG: hypothetical protein R3E08_09060 [Thiotrichaceae bacterium]